MFSEGNLSIKASELLNNNKKILAFPVQTNILKTLICTAIAPKNIRVKSIISYLNLFLKR